MKTHMKAIVQLAQGSADGLRLQEVEKPTPKANEVLVQVHTATVTAGDVVMRKLPRLVYPVLALMGLKRKSIPGHEFAGVVEAVGEDVTRFQAGSQVFGTTTGLRVGANAEYVCVPETSKSGVIAVKPANISYEQAAALPVGGMTALQILRKANIQHGQRALIYGASGSVGSYAVQLAKYFGADVTGVCSAANFEMVQSLGADSVIDYASGDFTQSTQTYDVIFDAVGKTSHAKLKNVLAENGVYLSVKSPTSEKLEYLSFLGELAEKGHIKPFIDARYPLEQTPAAHRYVETGRKKGNIVITVVNP